MSNENPVANIPAEVAENLTPEAKATFREQMIAAGFSQADLDAAFAKPVQRAPLDPNGKVFRTTAEADASIEASRRAAEDRIRQNIAEFTAAGDYEFQLHGRATADVADIKTMMVEFSNAFHAMALPKNLAQPLVDAFLQSQDETDGLNTAQRADYNATQRSMLSKMTGGAELMKLAASALARMPDDTRNDLHKFGCLESARTIVMLANSERAIEAREKATK